jgi:hypothetical protein
LRYIASVAKHFTEELLEELGYRLTVVSVPRSEQDIEQFPLLIDDQMQFEAKEPIDGSFASSRQRLEHFVGSNPTVMADLDTGCINETESRTLTKALAQIAAQGNQC